MFDPFVVLGVFLLLSWMKTISWSFLRCNRGNKLAEEGLLSIPAVVVEKALCRSIDVNGGW